MSLYFLIVFIWVLVRTGIFKNIPAIRIKRRFRRLQVNSIFDRQDIDSKELFVHLFNKIPSSTYIENVEINEVYKYVNAELKNMVDVVHQSNFFNWKENIQQFHTTIFVLNNKAIIELSGSCAEIFYVPAKFSFAEALLKKFSEYKKPEKKKELEINIISLTDGSLELKALDIKPANLDIDLFYNDDFKEIDALIKERLSKTQDKGIVLLHGLPGTGKTTYLRHLVGEMKKKVLFVSPAVAQNLMSPDLIDLLIDNPDSILVIEDAENIIMDRKFDSNSSVSNILNLSDGLLSDCLNVQIICTFNNALSMIDPALMRKGRLIARYEFGKLAVQKAQRLSDSLGLTQVITKPSTLAEITNADDKEFESDKIEVIGFRRKMEMVN
jgi:ATPase family protein associated with various cellular activities (AAA)